MTGGSSPGDRARASKWNQNDYNNLKVALEAATRELESLGTVQSAAEKEQELLHRLDSTEQELKHARTDLQLTSSKESKFRTELGVLTTAHSQAVTDLKKLKKKRLSQQSDVERLTKQCNEEEDRIFAKFSKSLGLSSVRDYEEKQLGEAQEKEKQMLELRAQEAKLQSTLQFETRKDLPKV